MKFYNYFFSFIFNNNSKDDNCFIITKLFSTFNYITFIKLQFNLTIVGVYLTFSFLACVLHLKYTDPYIIVLCNLSREILF